jgi:hypothetical protein
MPVVPLSPATLRTSVATGATKTSRDRAERTWADATARAAVRLSVT